MRGQHPLLKHTEVLQHILLPLLTAREVLCLGVTCRAMLIWVLSNPPSSCQVTLSITLCSQAAVTYWVTLRQVARSLSNLTSSRPESS